MPQIRAAVGKLTLLALAAFSNHPTRRMMQLQGASSIAPSQVTSLDIDSSDVASLWRKYSSAAALENGSEDTLWSTTERARWKMFDLNKPYIGAAKEQGIKSIKKVVSDGDTEYEISIGYSAEGGSDRPEPTVRTVFATRQGGTWVLSNALRRRTKDWRRSRVGPIEFVYEPGYRADADRAHSAALFIDSLAVALGVPRLPALEYYVTSNRDVVFHILGVDFNKTTGIGGLAQPTNKLLLSGTPAVGENYRHELSHVVLLPLMQDQSLYFVSEGIPTWLGGTSGLTFRQGVAQLHRFLALHPGFTLDSLIVPRGVVSSTEMYEASSVITELVFAKGGTAAVKNLLAVGPRIADLQSHLEQLFGKPWAQVVMDWRATIERIASTEPPTTPSPPSAPAPDNSRRDPD